MAHKNYIKGRTKEYKIKKKYEKLGMIVVRSAGSHGSWDLVAVDFVNKRIHFIQCKPDDIGESARNVILRKNEYLNDEYQCSFSVE